MECSLNTNTIIGRMDTDVFFFLSLGVFLLHVCYIEDILSLVNHTLSLICTLFRDLSWCLQYVGERVSFEILPCFINEVAHQLNGKTVDL